VIFRRFSSFSSSKSVRSSCLTQFWNLCKLVISFSLNSSIQFQSKNTCTIMVDTLNHCVRRQYSSSGSWSSYFRMMDQTSCMIDSINRWNRTIKYVIALLCRIGRWSIWEKTQLQWVCHLSFGRNWRAQLRSCLSHTCRFNHTNWRQDRWQSHYIDFKRRSLINL
jgi:hypothetical protein